jgi:hypothetical protein
MDATMIMKTIQTIVSRPADFCPMKSRISNLNDVQLAPKHTEIIFVRTNDGQELRLEGEIDSAFDGGPGKHQFGSTRLFRDDQRNKRVEVTTIDIGRYR